MLHKFKTRLKREGKDAVAWRHHDVTRIEAFSDAVFGFAITLLIVSLEVPKNAHELLESMKGFFPFAACFAIIFFIWRAQYIFFRRYGLHDNFTLGLNGALLFMVLFYVYPMKFLVSSWFLRTSGNIAGNDMRYLIGIYSGGYAIIFLLFALMYYNALQKKTLLKLTVNELFETENTMYQYWVLVGVGVLSTTLGLIGGNCMGFAFASYALIGPVIWILYAVRYKKRRKKHKLHMHEMETTHLNN